MLGYTNPWEKVGPQNTNLIVMNAFALRVRIYTTTCFSETSRDRTLFCLGKYLILQFPTK